MAEPLIINTNPEKLFNFLLCPAIKRMHSIASSSSAAEFNHKHLKMVQVAEKSFYLKSFGLIIIFRCRRPIVTKKSNLDHIFLFLFKATNTSNLDRLCFENGKLIVALVPRIAFGNPPVKKLADAESGDSNAPDQHGVQQNQNNIEMVDDAGQPNNNGDGGNGNKNDGNDSGNGNGNDGDHDDDEDDDDDDDDDCFRIGVYRGDVNVNNWMVLPTQVISTEIIADNYESWEQVSHAMHHIYLAMGDANDNNGNARTHVPTVDLNPWNCWPGCWTTFAFVTVDGLFYPVNSDVTPWTNVKDILNCFIVLRPVHDA